MSKRKSDMLPPATLTMNHDQTGRIETDACIIDYPPMSPSFPSQPGITRPSTAPMFPTQPWDHYPYPGQPYTPVVPDNQIDWETLIKTARSEEPDEVKRLKAENEKLRKELYRARDALSIYLTLTFSWPALFNKDVNVLGCTYPIVEVVAAVIVHNSLMPDEWESKNAIQQAELIIAYLKATEAKKNPAPTPSEYRQLIMGN